MSQTRVRLNPTSSLEELAALPWDSQLPFGYEAPIEGRTSACPEGIQDAPPSTLRPLAVGPVQCSLDRPAAPQQLSMQRYTELVWLLAGRSGSVDSPSKDALGQVRKEELRQV